MFTTSQQTTVFVNQFNELEVNYYDIVLQDGVEISRKQSGNVFQPGRDLADQDPKVQAIAAVVWTPEVLAAKAAQAEAIAEPVAE